MRPCAAILGGVVLAALFVLPAASADAAFPGENGMIALACDGVCVVDPATGDWEQLTDQARGIDYEPSFSANGKRIVFSRYRLRTSRTGIFVMRSDGTRIKRLTDGRSDSSPAFSPDGRHIVFQASPRRSAPRIVMIDRYGQNRHALARGLTPSFSPDGEHIVFTRRGSDARRGYLRTYTMAADGTGVTPITPDGPDARYPSYSPSGGRIILDYYDPETSFLGVATIAADGSDFTEVELSPPTPEFYVSDPVFSPDGTQIALMHIDQRWLDESCRCVFLATMSTDGTGLTHVLSGGGSPDWGPAPQP